MLQSILTGRKALRLAVGICCLIIFALLFMGCEEVNKNIARLQGNVACSELEGTCKPVCESFNGIINKETDPMLSVTPVNWIVKTKGNNSGTYTPVVCPNTTDDCCVTQSFRLTHYDTMEFYHREARNPEKEAELRELSKKIKKQFEKK